MFADVMKSLPESPLIVRKDDTVPDVAPTYDNENIGDCTCASVAHLYEVWTGYGRLSSLLTTADVINFYCEVGGYVTGDPRTDNGADMLTVLNQWRNVGIGPQRRKIAAFAKLDHTNIDHVKIAINLFGGVYVGAQLPKSAQSAVEHGDGWIDGDKRDAGTWGGHCMSASRADRSGVWFRTWGKPQFANWRWWLTYVDECYAPMSPDWTVGAAAMGLDMDRLRQYLSQL
jgi:hypothetical protein